MHRISMELVVFLFVSLMNLVLAGLTTLKLDTPLIMKLSRNSSLKYLPVLVEVPGSANYDFVIPQIHTQSDILVSSMNEAALYGYESNGTDTGTLQWVLKNQNLKAYFGVNSNCSVESLLMAIPSMVKSPVPGACCLTCALENDPNIRVTYDTFETRVVFERASAFWDRASSYPHCDDKPRPRTFDLRYELYYYYLDERDLTLRGLFDGLWKMSNPSRIKKHGTRLVQFTKEDKLRVTTEAVYGQGVVFNVIVTDDVVGLSSAYVPTATYACDFTTDDCKSLGSITSMVYCILFALVGIVMCFAGFKLFRILLFCSGIVVYWFVIYVLIARYVTNWKSRDVMIISSACSLVGGGIVLLMFAFKRSIYLCIINICVAYGLFVSAIIFYTPFGYMEIWDQDYHFALGYICFILLLTAIFLFYPKIVSYLFSSMLGSYAVIMVPNYFLGANMQYIVLTIILRLTVSDFGSSYLRRPYQKLDYILTGTWAALFILGYTVQYCTTKNDDFFVSGKEIRRKAWKKFSESVSMNRRGRKKPKTQKYYTPSSNERSPLMHDNTGYGSTLSFNNTSQQPNLSTFKPENQASIATGPSTQPSSVEHQALMHQSPPSNQPRNNYESAWPSAPPAYYDDRYPKIV